MAAAAIIAAEVAIGAGAVALANKYQDATNKMAAQAGISVKAAQAIGTAFLATSGQTTFSAQAMMTAFGPVSGQLGLVEGHALTAGESLTFMRAAMALAEATSQPLGTTTAALSGVMQAYAISVGGAANASDLLFNTSRVLAMPVTDVAAAVDKLHAKLGPLAPSLGDVSTLLVDVASHGLTGSRALMLVSTGMNTLLGGSKATTAELKTLGLNVFDASGKFIGMQATIAQLSPKMAGLTEQQRLLAEKALFGAGASKALDATILAGVPAWDKATAAATKHGTAAVAAATATNTISGAFDKLKAAGENVGIQLGQKLQPIIQTIIGWFAVAATWLASILPTALTVLGNYWNVVFTVIGGVVKELVAIIQTAVGVITAVVMRLGVIFSILGATVYNVFNAVIVPVINTVATPIAFIANLVGTVLVGAFHALQAVATAVFNAILAAVNKVAGPIGAVVGAIGKVAGVIGGAVGAVGGFLGHLAGGGVIAPGAFAVVGEGGAELAFGGTSGLSILNRSQVLSSAASSLGGSSVPFGGGSVAGSVVIHQNITVNGLTAADVVPAIRAEISRHNTTLVSALRAGRR
jgi:TP901 family phage tail tape measure protein